MVSRWAESETSILALRAIRRPLGRADIQHRNPERLAAVGADDDAGFDRTVHHPPIFDRRGRHARAPAGIERVSHAAGDAQVALGIELALVASVQPAVFGQRARAALHAAVSLADGAGALHAGQRGV